MKLLNLLMIAAVCVVGSTGSASAQQDTVLAEARATDSQIRRMTIKLCSSLSIADVDDTGEPVEVTLERIMLKYSGISPDEPDYKLRLANFWNRYNDRIICPPHGTKSYPRQHFFIRSVTQGYHLSALENYFFADAEAFPIDPNVAIINQHGYYETVLDYAGRVIASAEAAAGKYNIYQLNRIMRTIEDDFGGKRFKELNEK